MPLAANACRNQKSLSPNQPANFKYPERGYKDSNRSFQPQWYKRWKWLHYNERKDSVTCYVCWHARLHHMLPNMKIDDAFIESGYANWKNAIDTKESFNQHEKSAVHRSAVNRFVEVPSSTDDIDWTVTKHLLEIQQKNLSALMKILCSIRYLVRQRLPLRSHNDSESNFRQLTLLRAVDDGNFQEWLHKETNRFISPAIQNEILKDMSMHILRPIVKNIKESSCYSIMADETTDIINKEQFVICIRWVDNDLKANEDFIGLHVLRVTNAETLAFTLKDVVLRLGLDPVHLRGQCYDSCSTMMRKKSGVATTIKNVLNKNALAIHCHPHALNPACGDSIKHCKLTQNAFETSFKTCTKINLMRITTDKYPYKGIVYRK